MATEQAVAELQKRLAGAAGYSQSALEARPEWGTMNFRKGAKDLARIFEIVGQLSLMPLEGLPDSAPQQIQSDLELVIGVLDAINKFDIEQQNPQQVRDDLLNRLHSYADQLVAVAGHWIPYLAFQRGDVQKNIEALTEAVTQARKIIDDAKVSVQIKSNEIDKIVTAAREASATAGAAVFTQDFDRESAALDKRAAAWLKTTGVLAGVALCAAIAMFWAPADSTETPYIVQRFGGKLAILVVLFTAALWCGRTYKALVHLSTINRHRALSLQTFQAFTRAASDDPTRNAVLLESTRAIFGSVPTGFVDARDSGDQDIKIIEVVKSLGTKGGGAAS